MITESSYKILGGSNHIILFLAFQNQRVKDKLYPQELRNEVDKHLSWFLSRMKPSSTRIVKMMVNPKINASEK